MDSYQLLSPFSKSSAVAENEKTGTEPISWNSEGAVVDESTDQQQVSIGGASYGFVGSLDVFIHQARDIQNICIYHKQDVYAKLCLTSDPDVDVSTKVINCAGRNPVFNENLRLNVRSIESSLKCEIWMLSRVKNYLEDQLLGFALVPLSDVIIGNGKLAEEFSLTSTDLFHSPAGFVQLSLSYTGFTPEVISIPALPTSAIRGTIQSDSANGDSMSCEYDKIEFPDLEIVKENQMMVSEYFGMPCTNTHSTESLITSETGNCPNDDAGVRVVDSFLTEHSFNSVLKEDTPQSSVSTNGSPSTLPATSPSFSGPSGATGSPVHIDKITEGAECEADSSVGLSDSSFVPHSINMNMELEQTVVQQDIVDMYMKSMQQFTEKLAKMKLPMDIEKSSINTDNANSGSEQESQASKGTGPRVFYGSRAFF